MRYTDRNADGKVRRMLFQSRRERSRRGRRRLATALLTLASLSATALVHARSPSIAMAVESTVTAEGADCRALAVWPMSRPVITQGFVAPATQWSAGHRGIDLHAQAGDDILAPVSGVVSFRGKVALKSVVSIARGSLTFTFEPAATALPIGAAVIRGDAFASVGGESDHCESQCIHWGIRRGDEYIDPATRTVSTRIVLKSP
ncbi:MAG: peptidoglycan DD-metalloendopeptidase family protein [Bifidobacterium sp.]